MEPHDGMAFIGRNPMDKSNVFVVTGDSGNGITHGAVASMLLSDLIQGRSNPWQDLYDPGRIKLKSAGGFVKENVNVAAQYATGYLGPAELDDPAKIARGEGAILRRGLKKIAAFHDDDGVMYARSAVCPHLGCIVAWNGVEKTWDCPCHGSRFDRYGKVFNGPANADLAMVADLPMPADAT
jgi:Rieske Fe-S protein